MGVQLCVPSRRHDYQNQLSGKLPSEEEKFSANSLYYTFITWISPEPDHTAKQSTLKSTIHQVPLSVRLFSVYDSKRKKKNRFKEMERKEKKPCRHKIASLMFSLVPQNTCLRYELQFTVVKSSKTNLGEGKTVPIILMAVLCSTVSIDYIHNAYIYFSPCELKTLSCGYIT